MVEGIGECQNANLGDQKREKYMLPGEVWMANWPKSSKDQFIAIAEWRIPGEPIMRRSNQVIYELYESGLYKLVRSIPAFDVNGRLVPGAVGIVVRPKTKYPR